MDEIKDLRRENLEESRLIRAEMSDLKKEFYLFKGKAFGFMGLLSILFSIAVDFIKGKI